MYKLDLSSRTALVTGVADNVGFAWHIAKTLQAAGAKIIISCHPRVRTILERFLKATLDFTPILLRYLFILI